ncbi:MAG: RNase adapter RapZ [Pseudomonadota bacterium]|jgi:UPF0042 nucleotide-binding protein
MAVMIDDSTQRPKTATKQRVLLVTGMLGAGKTTALRVLEDLGWEVMDNFPIRLLERLLDSHEADHDEHTPLAIGFDSRTRGFNPHAITSLVKKLNQRHDLELTTIYLDCSGEELQRRYNETRRRHHLAIDMPAASGISAEREIMEPLRRWADMVISTTAFAANELQQAIRELFAPDYGPDITLTISSFGFARGMPPVADFVFDMRFLDNPHWDPAIRPLTGQDAAVAEFIQNDPAFAEVYNQILQLLLTVLPRFKDKAKAYVHIAFGCTGGKHRSVYMAEKIAAALLQHAYRPTILHRNLANRATDLIHGAARK